LAVAILLVITEIINTYQTVINNNKIEIITSTVSIVKDPTAVAAAIEILFFRITLSNVN